MAAAADNTPALLFGMFKYRFNFLNGMSPARHVSSQYPTLPLSCQLTTSIPCAIL